MGLNWRNKTVLLMAMFMISIMSVFISLAEADATVQQEATEPGYCRRPENQQFWPIRKPASGLGR